MAFYTDEQQIWKCQKHPSKRRTTTTGICPTCLRERLLKLCPECSNTRPCSCYPQHSISTSSSSSSSIATEQATRVSTLIENEPPFRRSRSLLAVPLRSKSKKELVEVDKKNTPSVSWNKINFWSIFKTSKTRKYDLHDDESNKGSVSGGGMEDYSRMMRSRSVAVGAGDSFTTKRRGWHLPGPMKAFRHSKTSKLQVHDRSPVHRG
ncbi:hypothetical protein HanPSC8_Chr06g0234631 [Helianthus annuus]|nr:hypothetical protein HanPSC8_Chr06g0234631 [Helianthus annuus]